MEYESTGTDVPLLHAAVSENSQKQRQGAAAAAGEDSSLQEGLRAKRPGGRRSKFSPRLDVLKNAAAEGVKRLPLIGMSIIMIEQLDRDEEEFRKWYEKKFGEPYDEHNNRFTRPKHNNVATMECKSTKTDVPLPHAGVSEIPQKQRQGAAAAAGEDCSLQEGLRAKRPGGRRSKFSPRLDVLKNAAAEGVKRLPLIGMLIIMIEELDRDDEEFRKWYEEKFGEPYDEHNNRFTRPKHNNIETMECKSTKTDVPLPHGGVFENPQSSGKEQQQ